MLREPRQLLVNMSEQLKADSIIDSRDKNFVEMFLKFSDKTFTESFFCPLVTYAREGLEQNGNLKKAILDAVFTPL